ncbi:TIR domain-containing protein [Polyangium sp. 6x1]|uniref:toll/interleukin-1 receptor domain-containing protein n=1 Tax=Polyangium sp. 6x1 TaxID=3042689 RepID=UPI002482DE83|nr:TIR domain-containing protein [Polyangium sp. 6x1]MDI1442425.1 TIR domain-containing protein [Polyangium sp. 6x1]
MTAKAPTIFISYAWEDDVKDWVRELATRLRKHGGVDVHIDQWHLAPGDHLPAFMQNAVRTNDFVLLVCTPKYKAKADTRQGGVGYEGDIITAEVFTKANHRKFIPLLRKGDWQSAAPSFLLGKVYIDFRGDPYRDSAYEDLLKTLHGQLERPPTLGYGPASGGASAGPRGGAQPPLDDSARPWGPAIDSGRSPPARANGVAKPSGANRIIFVGLMITLLVVTALAGFWKWLLPAPSTRAELLGQPERGWVEAYGAALDSGDVDRIIAFHVLPTPRFFLARNQDAMQLRRLYQGWFDGDGRIRRTGFDGCSLAKLADDGSRALRCTTYVDPPFSNSPSRVPTCLVFRADGKLLSRTELTKSEDCPPN